MDEGSEKAISKNNSPTNSTKVMDVTRTSNEMINSDSDDNEDSLNDSVSN